MLELRNITKHLDDRPVLRHINMCAGEGELCAVAGKKDSGRSTLLRIAGGIIRPDAGSVILDDRPVFDNRYSRQKLFYISEVPVLYQGKSLKSLTRFYGKAYGRFDSELFDQISHQFDLSFGLRLDKKERTPAIKAMLATGMCIHPEYILLDDPFEIPEEYDWRKSIKRSGEKHKNTDIKYAPLDKKSVTTGVKLRGIRIQDDDIVDMLKYAAGLGIGVIYTAQVKDVLPGITDKQFVLDEM